MMKQVHHLSGIFVEQRVRFDSLFLDVFLKYLTVAFFEKLQKMFGWKFLKNSLFLKNTSVWIDQFFKNTTYWITAQ